MKIQARNANQYINRSNGKRDVRKGLFCLWAGIFPKGKCISRSFSLRVISSLSSNIHMAHIINIRFLIVLHMIRIDLIDVHFQVFANGDGCLGNKFFIFFSSFFSFPSFFSHPTISSADSHTNYMNISIFEADHLINQSEENERHDWPSKEPSNIQRKKKMNKCIFF